MSRFTIILVILRCLVPASTRTYKNWFRFDVYSDNTVGYLFDVQERSFQFGSTGSIQAYLSCNLPANISWGSNPAFNLFLCEEDIKTRWLYLYPDWGMCFQEYHYYHHCSIDEMKQTGPTTWAYNKTISQSQNIVNRVRTCPIYVAPQTAMSFLGQNYILRTYRCEYTGIFLNNHSRLSQDEIWNPLVYGMLTVIYAALVAKGVYEIIRFWKYRVKCSFHIYSLVLLKFLNILTTAFYYRRIVFEEDLMKGYEDLSFFMSMTQAGKFAAYYLTILAIASGYCIYNTKFAINPRVHAVLSSVLFTVFFYLNVINDSYVEVPLVVIVSAAYAAVLAVFWAFHLKRLMMVRYQIQVEIANSNNNINTESDQFAIAKDQIKYKEILVGVAFAEILSFLAFIIVFEFFRADNYPVPGTTGVVVTECLELVLILPLAMLYNMRDLSRYYPKPAPPPLIHVIKTPGEGYKISLIDGDRQQDMTKELSVNEETSEIHIIQMPSRSGSSSTSIPTDNGEPVLI